MACSCFDEEEEGGQWEQINGSCFLNNGIFFLYSLSVPFAESNMAFNCELFVRFKATSKDLFPQNGWLLSQARRTNVIV